MIILKKAFKNFHEITKEFKSIDLRFFDEILDDEDVTKFDDFTDKCIDIFKSYHVRTDSIYYRPNARFDLNINKFGTTISFDNRTALTIEPIDQENTDGKGFNVIVSFYMPCEKVYMTDAYKFMIANEWKASSDVRKANTKKKETTTNPVLVESLNEGPIYDIKDSIHALKHVDAKPVAESKFIATTDF